MRQRILNRKAISRTWQAACQAAFSLPEVSMAIAIVGLLSFFLLTGISFGFTQVRNERENRRASQVMLDKLEQIRLFNWEQITTNGLPNTFIVPFYTGSNGLQQGFNYTGTVAITSAPFTEDYAHSLRQIKIQVRWESAGLYHQREMTSLLSSNGLYRYVY